MYINYAISTYKIFLLILSLCFLCIFTSTAHADDQTKSKLDKNKEGMKPLLDFRVRYEAVSDDSKAEDGRALTYRFRTGFEANVTESMNLLFEIEHIDHLVDDFNDTRNGKVNHAVIADPNTTALNRAQLSYTGIDKTKITFGRQRINVGDQRFIGSVNWRQNDQTFDAVRVENSSINGLRIDATYINRVNRIFGRESSMGTWKGDIYAVNADYRLSAFDQLDVTLNPFALLINLENSPASSSQTYGIGVLLKSEVFRVKGRYASQSDFANQPLDYNADYLLLDGSYNLSNSSIGAGYEVLGGNGVKGFQTPLATGHKFNGWSDKFLTTPSEGLEDLYIKATYNVGKKGPLEKINLHGAFHTYSANSGDADYGDEINFKVSGKLGKTNITAKMAEYSANTFSEDKSIFTLQLDYGL